jgi:hypothetical protein
VANLTTTQVQETEVPPYKPASNKTRKAKDLLQKIGESSMSTVRLRHSPQVALTQIRLSPSGSALGFLHARNRTEQTRRSEEKNHGPALDEIETVPSCRSAECRSGCPGRGAWGKAVSRLSGDVRGFPF